MTRIILFPGQGSQQQGMGGELFERFSALTDQADEVLGYSIRELCLNDPAGRLTETQFTQPALFVVNALSYRARIEDGEGRPDFVAGHSLGEYNALLAAGAFDFRTGLELVKKRGQLMAEATGGGMAAILGTNAQRVQEILGESGWESIDVANLNTPDQTVISGRREDVESSREAFEEAGARFIPLRVGGAFHSRYMQPAQDEFEHFLEDFDFSPLQIPVLSNVHARPYEAGEIKQNLSRQITAPVRWVETIEYLLSQREPEFEEIGPGRVLTGLLRKIRRGARG